MKTVNFSGFFIFLVAFFGIPSLVFADKNPGDSLDVIHYDIHLQNIDITSQTIEGFTTLTLTPKTATLAELHIELLALTTDSVKVNGISADFEQANNILLKVIPQQPLMMGDTAEVCIYYHGHPFTDASGWGGFHFSGNYAFNLGVGFDSNPHNLGKAWFPCIDDFTDRALYDMYITVADDITAICGGTLISETSNGNGTKIFHWKMANDIPTYLASVAVGSYVAVRDTFDGMNQRVPIAIYVRPADSVKAVGSFVHLKEILAIYENRFGPYSWERVGYVGASLGAMEHATNITYPNSSINGNTTDEWLYAHELSHMWFGDKVTCASAEDMWLNEGWAVFCESVFKEGLYGKQAYKDNIRSKLKEVLQFTHHTDLEYRAIYGIPPEFTYGSTVYDKGGQVAHTLRGYLGDSLFFDGIKGFLTEFVYNHASSWDLRDYLTARTGINLDAFFETWIFTPGFPHFSVDSFTVVPTDNQYNVTVYTKQKARGTNHYSAANRVEITFLNDQWNFTSDTMIFSGLTGQKTFQLPFAPEAVLMDANDKLSDAVTAYSDTIKGTGLREYPDCFFKLDVQNVSNSAFLRIEHNWVAPDSLKTPQYGLTLSDYRYWKVDGIFPAEFSANGWFNYNKGSYLDNTLITDPDDSLVILYRPSPASDWQAIAFTRIGPWGIGNVIVNNLQKGEYTLAVWDETVAGAGEKKNKAGGFLLYPNPSGSDVIIEYSIEKKGVMEVYSLAGKKMDAFRLSPGKHQYCYKHSQLTSGTYLLKMRLDAGEDYIVKKLVIH